MAFLTKAAPLAAVVFLAACGGSPETSSPPAANAPAAEPSSAAGGGTAGSAAAATRPEPPAELPDPCRLLSAEAASTLGASPGLTPAPAKAEMSTWKACQWNSATGNGIVQLEIGRLYPPTPEGLTDWQRSYLRNEAGKEVPDVGDGAKVGGSTPVQIVVTANYFVFRLKSYNGSMDVFTLLPDAARQVVRALP